jgi:hypothetical protein
MGLFTPLTSGEKSLSEYPSGILASGEANYEDTSQAEIVTVFTTSVPVLNRNGFNFTENNNLSNAPLSRDLSINAFTIFNPYIHYVKSPKGGQGMLEISSYAFEIDTASFYNLSASGFNIYNTKYRKSL